jgi:nucleotide-binding universal stress UspA family protein
MKIRKILYPTDFSTCARQAFGPATSLARRYGAELHVFHALVLHGQEPYDPMFYLPAAEEAYAAAALWVDKELATLRETSTAEGAQVVCVQQRDFDPAAAILDYAGQMGIDLIVLGTHGRRGAARLLLGSVAEDVIRHSACPVLVMRETESGNRPVPLVRRILVPFDFSAASREAVAAAADVAGHYGSRLTLLHVLEEPAWPEIYGVEAAAELVERRRLALAEGVRRLREAGADLASGIPWDAEVHLGRPATEILGIAARSGYDLIVMGSRGLSGVRRLLFGSTAEEVIRAAALPVMVVKPAGEALPPTREAVAATADAPA